MMSRFVKRMTAVAVALAVVGCAPSTPEDTPEDTSAADLEAIRQLHDRELEAFASGDRAAIDEVFTDDAVLMPPGEPTVEGKEERHAWLDGFYEHWSVEVSYTSAGITLAGDWAFERLDYTMSLTPAAGGETVAHDGTGVHIYERQPDGSWKIAWDIWNMNQPAEGGSSD